MYILYILKFYKKSPIIHPRNSNGNFGNGFCGGFGGGFGGGFFGAISGWILTGIVSVSTVRKWLVNSRNEPVV